MELPGPGGATLRALLLRSPGAVGTALVLHGWGGSALDMLPVGELLREEGLDAVLLDARAHGRSDDVTLTSMPAFADDLSAAISWWRFTSFAPLEVIQTLDLPLVIVHGQDDATISVEDAWQLARAAPHAELVVVPGAGHSDTAVVSALRVPLRRLLEQPAGQAGGRRLGRSASFCVVTSRLTSDPAGRPNSAMALSGRCSISSQFG